MKVKASYTSRELQLNRQNASHLMRWFIVNCKVQATALTFIAFMGSFSLTYTVP